MKLWLGIERRKEPITEPVSNVSRASTTSTASEETKSSNVSAGQYEDASVRNLTDILVRLRLEVHSADSHSLGSPLAFPRIYLS